MLNEILDIFSNYQHWFAYLTITSIALLLLSIIFIPKIVARIPNDYFVRSHPNKFPFSISRLISNTIKNIIGIILVAGGIFMLVLPGQGLLTIFVGLLLINFPGKYKIERYLIRKPAVLNSLNWLRRKQNVSELLVD